MPISPSSHLGKSSASTSYLFARPVTLSLTKLFVLGVLNLPRLRASPLILSPFVKTEEDPPLTPQNPTLWIYLTVAVGLVLLGGAFAGLTIALMGQDEIYLQVIEKSGEHHEKRYAASVLRLLQRGKHWVLVTLLLGNVITNETLPIILDRSLGGGWPAVLGSTALIVIFGEIIPQSICVRYGLPIGAYMSPLVLFLMYVLAPVAWPTAKLLDRLLGEDHGTTYKKAGLKTLVTLHKTLGAAGEQLNSDEVTIISAVLDLKAKPVGSIMTPMEDVFTMSADTILDEKTMDIILNAGYSRIPIYAPENPQNFVGMLLVKILIIYDPEDCKRVREFSLATLPETLAETSCLDIVNFFQEGKSHMVLVSEFPGEDRGALGVVTLEDVMEELIGEEIVDESDVFIDVHKAIRRLQPAPRYRVPKGDVVAQSHDTKDVIMEEDLIDLDGPKLKPESLRQRSNSLTLKVNGSHPENAKITSPRRPSSTMAGSDREGPLTRASTVEHLKHLGPSNVASRPRQTRFNTVKIKPGAVYTSLPGHKSHETPLPTIPSKQLPVFTAEPHGDGANHAKLTGKNATDGVLTAQAGYGTMNKSPKPSNGSTQSQNNDKERSLQRGQTAEKSYKPPALLDGSETASTVASLSRRSSEPYWAKKTNSIARSGSITENIIDAGGIKKTILETTSSDSEDSDEDGGAALYASDVGPQSYGFGAATSPGNGNQSVGGGRRKRRRRKRKAGTGEGENKPLLSRTNDEVKGQASS